jgi:hypothetical protein
VKLINLYTIDFTGTETISARATLKAESEEAAIASLQAACPNLDNFSVISCTMVMEGELQHELPFAPSTTTLQ